MQNRGRRPDTKRPRPVAAGDFLAISSVPDAFVKFSQWAEAPWSLLRGLCWNHRFRPLCASVPPLVRGAGPLLEPLVPPLVRLRAPGFIPDLCRIYSHPSPLQEERRKYCEKCVRNGNRIYAGFMQDLERT